MTPEELLIMFTMATEKQPKPPALPPEPRRPGTADPLCPKCGGLGYKVVADEDTDGATDSIVECDCLWDTTEDE